jgi:hypothetical protein
MVFEEGGGVLELASLAFAAVGLDVAELVERFLELAAETVALDGEVVNQAVGVDDVKVDSSLLVAWIGSAVEHIGFEQWDVVEAPGGVDEFLDELSFGGSAGLYSAKNWRRWVS